MKLRQLVVVLVSLLLIMSVLLNIFPAAAISTTQTTPDVYFGVDMGYGTDVAGAKSLIDQVSSFTNFFVLGASALSDSITQLNQTLQYAYDKGMYFMSYPPSLYTRNFSSPFAVPNATQAWLDYAKANWGNRYVGLLYPYEDEPGGHQLDMVSGGNSYRPANITKTENTTYVDAEQQFIDSVWFMDLNRTKMVTGYPVFTSDYALYYFDYKAGYDGLFAEFGWNYSRQLNMVMCRGAANVLNKEWGVIVTYEYTEPPYIESPTELYHDLIYAYDSGAKYIVVFNSNPDWTGGILTEEHYMAMQQFWQYTQDHPRETYPVNERTAYVLPEAYAYGFRGPLDKIWGVWEADMTSFVLSISVYIMMEKYGSKLDVIYEDAMQSGETYGYKNIIYWNDPSAVADRWPPGYLPIPTPKYSTTPAPSTSTGSTQTSSPSSVKNYEVSETFIYGCLAAVVVIGVVAGVFMFKKKPHLRS
ncbi:MAG: hypothetical protein NWF05_10750 [Candidatus Bathyarchaeota archaeon]|nr:hypothetical protein [Candidatus Bathyarchaeota archaeon]